MRLFLSLSLLSQAQQNFTCESGYGYLIEMFGNVTSVCVRLCLYESTIFVDVCCVFMLPFKIGRLKMRVIMIRAK